MLFITSIQIISLFITAAINSSLYPNLNSDNLKIQLRSFNILSFGVLMGMLAVRPVLIVIILEEIIFNNSFYLSDFVLIRNSKLLYYPILAIYLATLIIISFNPRISVLINSLMPSFFAILISLLIYATSFNPLIHISRLTNLSIIYSLSLYLSQINLIR